MKSLTLFSVLSAVCFVSKAATITAVVNGSFTTPATWDLNRVPADGDKVVIPFGRTVSFNNTPFPRNNPAARPTLRIEISGTLDFSSPGNDKLYLDAGSVVQIYTNGKLMTSASSSEIIAIYDGSSDNTVWTGTPSTVNGSAYASATTVGFSNGILPLKLLSFTVDKTTDGKAKISWTTSMEMNTSFFEVEIRNDSHSWNAIARVRAAGNSTTALSYSCLVGLQEGVNEFRIRMVDIDGKYTYSAVVRLSAAVSASGAAIYYHSSSKQIICSGTGLSEGVVTIFDFNGRKVLSAKATERITFTPQVAGVYIVQLKISTTTISRKIAVYSL